VTTLLISKPLHFWNYGGMTLRIIWAILDVIAIILHWGLVCAMPGAIRLRSLDASNGGKAM